MKDFFGVIAVYKCKQRSAEPKLYPSSSSPVNPALLPSLSDADDDDADDDDDGDNHPQY